MAGMSISQVDPSLTMEKLQTQTEGQYYDRKSARIVNTRKEVARHISAFANASGGIIAIGIEDNGNITGITDNDENALRKTPIEYLSVPPQIQFEVIPCSDCNGNPSKIMLMHITLCADNIITLKDGDVYLRIGDSSKKLTPEEYVALEYSKGTKSFESTIVEDATLDNLDEGLLNQYTEVLGVSTSSSYDILKARGLIKERDGKVKITVAAVLLFGKMPTQFLQCARVRFLKYDGVSAGVGGNYNPVKDITIERPLHELLNEAQALLKSQMRDFHQLSKTGKFTHIPEYPDFAWLEGLVNAVTHRDYSILGEYIRITMFDDRIEFSSPGKLPSIVTVENIRNTRFSRNPIIARVLSDFGWVRELNEGVKRIYTDMANFFLDPPEFSEPNGNTVALLLKNNIAVRSLRVMESSMSTLEAIWPTLSALDKEIIYYIANIHNCTPRHLYAMTSKSRPTVSSHLKKLIELKAVVEHSSSPKDPTKYYTL